jgi:protein O-GlcNAc transferase
MTNVDEELSHAVRELRSRRLDVAGRLCHQVLAEVPNHAEALNLLGMVAVYGGNSREAIDWFAKAVAARPNSAEFHANLGNSLKDAGKFDDAIAAYRKAIELNPDLAAAHNVLGKTLRDKGEIDAALTSLKRALEIQPNYADAHMNLGSIYLARGENEDALQAYSRAASLNASSPDAHQGMSRALMALGKLDDAIAAQRRAVAAGSGRVDVHNNLGHALLLAGKLEEAMNCLFSAAKRWPDVATVQFNLGTVLDEMGRTEEALACFQLAARTDPKDARAHSHAGRLLLNHGQPDEAIAEIRTALDLMPEPFTSAAINAGSILVFAMQHSAAYGPAQILAQAKTWAARHADSMTDQASLPTNDRTPNRPLRVGYISADFRQHTISRFMLPLISHHNPREIQVACYSCVRRPDQVTEKYKGLSAIWRDVEKYNDERLAEQIRRDRIDILVDLSQHTAGNRLMALARRPAPVQVAWLGSAATTGMKAVDYRLTDAYVDPAGESDSFYTERLVRLPNCLWCYESFQSIAEPGPRPSNKDAAINFGCFARPAKVSTDMLELWADILVAIPQSRLLIHDKPGPHQAATKSLFARRGVEQSRIDFFDRQSLPEYFRKFLQIDVALDTYPYAGATTTFDALWMGVPVLTLAGPTAASRGSLSILSNLGLNEWIAADHAHYRSIAATMAADSSRLANLRAEMRDRMRASPITNIRQYTASLEAAYRQMWLTWCANH